jgi:hypothetical protein
MLQMGRPGLSARQKAELWARWKAGESLSDIGRALGKHAASVFGVLLAKGGIAPLARKRPSRSLPVGRSPTPVARSFSPPRTSPSRSRMPVRDSTLRLSYSLLRRSCQPTVRDLRPRSSVVGSDVGTPAPGRL